MIYTDFKKAFDQIDHHILLEKLNSFRFSNSLLLLFRSYLFNRKIFVRYRNFVSKPFCPNSGVPQGSNLGPLLFLLYINDVVDSLFCHKLLFADDLKIFHSISVPEDCDILPENINALSSWCASNRLLLNKNKCFKVTYSRK